MYIQICKISGRYANIVYLSGAGEIVLFVIRVQNEMLYGSLPHDHHEGVTPTREWRTLFFDARIGEYRCYTSIDARRRRRKV